MHELVEACTKESFFDGQHIITQNEEDDEFYAMPGIGRAAEECMRMRDVEGLGHEQFGRGLVCGVHNP